MRGEVAEARILVVDDEPGVRVALERILSDEGYAVTSVETAEAALEALDDHAFDAILLDVWLPGMDGLEALKQLGERRSDAEVVMISGHGNIETAVRATKLGAFDFVEKPLSLEKTLLVLRNALRQRGLERRNRHLLAQLARQTEIAGQSAAAIKLREEVEIAARSDAPVLVCGPSGSGRESVARRLHSSGPRADEPFVEVPCGALDAPAVEVAIFGTSDDPGRIRLAAAGTLFLEDVERLAPQTQRRLASSLGAQARERRPARVVASTRSGAPGLDPSLRQRLEVIRISVPSLTERRDDVPLLAERFIGDLAREYGREPKRLSPECLLALKAYGWPGNVAELRNLMERLLLFSKGDVVQRSDLPEELGGAGWPVEDLYRDFGSLDEGLRAFERHHIRRVLFEEHADRHKAARRLGLGPAELERRLEALRDVFPEGDS
jgi:two-component system nitrogen regulation response regulator NtrX